MPIVVSHQPDPRGIAGVAYEAGLGQYRLHQQEQALRWTQMALQNQQANQQAQLAYQRNALDAQQLQDQNARFMIDRNMQVGMDQQRMAQQQRQFDAGLAEQQRWRDAQLEQHRGDMDFRRESQQLSQQHQWDMAAQEHADRQAYAESQRKAAYEDFLNRNEAELTFEGRRAQETVKRRKSEVMSRLASGALSPGDAEVFLSQIDAHAAGLPIHSFVRPNPDAAQAKQELQARFDSQTVTFGDTTFQFDPNEGVFKPLRTQPNQTLLQFYKNIPRYLQQYNTAQQAHDLSGSTEPFADFPTWMQTNIPGVPREIFEETNDASMFSAPQPAKLPAAANERQQQMDATSSVAYKWAASVRLNDAPPAVREAAEYIKASLETYPTAELQAGMSQREKQQAIAAHRLLRQWEQSANAQRRSGVRQFDPVQQF